MMDEGYNRWESLCGVFALPVSLGNSWSSPPLPPAHLFRVLAAIFISRHLVSHEHARDKSTLWGFIIHPPSCTWSLSKPFPLKVDFSFSGFSSCRFFLIPGPSLPVCHCHTAWVWYTACICSPQPLGPSQIHPAGALPLSCWITFDRPSELLI